MPTTIGSFGALASSSVITSSDSSALAVGRQGSTSPAFVVDASASTCITGVSVTAAASGGGVAVAALGSTNEAMTVDAKGSGTLTLNGTATGNVVVGSALAFATDASAAKSIVAGTTNGLKIGTATTQKLGFFNTTPVVQPAHADQAAVSAISGGESPTESEHNALITLVLAIRTALVNLGLIKGAA